MNYDTLVSCNHKLKRSLRNTTSETRHSFSRGENHKSRDINKLSCCVKLNLLCCSLPLCEGVHMYLLTVTRGKTWKTHSAFAIFIGRRFFKLRSHQIQSCDRNAAFPIHFSDHHHQSCVSTIWRLCNTENYMTRRHVAGPVILITWNPPASFYSNWLEFTSVLSSPLV